MALWRKQTPLWNQLAQGSHHGIHCNRFTQGLKIEIDGIPYEVTEFQFVKPGKGQAMYKCRIKNMIAGNTMENFPFRGQD